MLLRFVELDSFTSDNYVQLFDQWQPPPPKQHSRRLSAVAWTSATPCCTACQTAFCGRFSPSRTPPHVWSQELDDATTSLRCCVSCIGCLSVNESSTRLHAWSDCMPGQSLAGQTPAYISDEIQLVTDSDRSRAQPPPGHASFHGRTTTSAIEASMLQARASRACGTVYRRTCDETWTLRVSSVNWKHLYLGVSKPRRIVTVCCFAP